MVMGSLKRLLKRFFPRMYPLASKWRLNLVSVIWVTTYRCRPQIFMLRMRVFLHSIYRRLFLARTGRKKISFCISTMNRHGDISQTLPQNLQDNARFAEDVEFVLVNFINGPEGMETDRWVRGNFKDEIKSGYLKYFVTDKMSCFHASVAKNTAHINASGLYLFNLDGDNYITSEETSVLLNQCIYGSVAHLWSGWRDGSYGRIGIGAYEFLALHGYNEAFLPKTYQDQDLLKRCLYLLGKRVFIRSEKTRAFYSEWGELRLSACLKVVKGAPAIKEALPSSYLARAKDTEFAGEVSSELDGSELLARMEAENRKRSSASTKGYTRIFKQEKIGVEVTAITADNLDSFFPAYDHAGLGRSRSADADLDKL